MKPACTRPGGSSYDETEEPQAKGTGKTKGKAIAKVQASSASSSTDARGSASTSSGGTGGAEALHAHAIKAVKEVHDLLKSTRVSRLQVDASLEDSLSGDSTRQAFESIRKGAVGEMGLLDGGATACMSTAKVHEHNFNYPIVNVSLALGEGHLMISPKGTLLSVEKLSPIVSHTALRKLGVPFAMRISSRLLKENGP